ncbi:hypothetical protein DXG01_017094 [Tephrocybe rancida]|nr:hypothetical protein DXG01_017094 [Tephrocybe rancida]
MFGPYDFPKIPPLSSGLTIGIKSTWNALEHKQYTRSTIEKFKNVRNIGSAPSSLLRSFSAKAMLRLSSSRATASLNTALTFDQPTLMYDEGDSESDSDRTYTSSDDDDDLNSLRSSIYTFPDTEPQPPSPTTSFQQPPANGGRDVATLNYTPNNSGALDAGHFSTPHIPISASNQFQGVGRTTSTEGRAVATQSLYHGYNDLDQLPIFNPSQSWSSNAQTRSLDAVPSSSAGLADVLGSRYSYTLPPFPPHPYNQSDPGRASGLPAIDRNSNRPYQEAHLHTHQPPHTHINRASAWTPDDRATESKVDTDWPNPDYFTPPNLNPLNLTRYEQIMELHSGKNHARSRRGAGQVDDLLNVVKVRPSPYSSERRNGPVKLDVNDVLDFNGRIESGSSNKQREGALQVSLEHRPHNPLGSLFSAEPERRTSIAEKIQRILEDSPLCRAFLRARGSDAQILLNMFQWLLDDPRLSEKLRRRLIVATQRLSTKSGLYPVCYELKGVVQDAQEPVTGGGFADIYKGHFEGHVVCLKTIRIYQDSQLDHVLKQFSKEVILWGQLSHTNVLPIYGLYRFKSRLCIVAPWMQNGDIVAYLKLNPDVDRRSLVLDVAKGLLYLHNNSIIHGDLKGPNILIDEQGRARLCDFGIASICDPEIKAWTTQSSVSSKGGSTRWQAPELFDITEDDEEVQNSVFSDVYAFGCVCYEVFTGKIPFYNILRDTTVTLQVKSAKRPSRPSEPGTSWQEWGLTENIWSLMEDCWKATASERPVVRQIIDRLSPLLEQDERASGRLNVLPPTHFRRSISEPPGVTSMASFDKLCDQILWYRSKGYETT